MIKRFLILTHVRHTLRDGQYFAYGPYVREMNIWLRLVEEVEILAPLSIHGKIDKGARRSREEGKRRHGDTMNSGGNHFEGNRGKEDYGIAYKHTELTFTQIPSFHFLNFIVAVKALIMIPYILYKILGAMRRADHLHLRCPGNIGMLACICQIFFPGKPKSAKYAGNWDPQAEQPWTYKLQKWILTNTFLTRNIQVLAYGEWPGQTKNIKPFFTASFSKQEISAHRDKTFQGRPTFLFVGNLVPGKNPLKAIQLIQEIGKQKSRSQLTTELSLEIYGDGPQRKMLEEYCQKEKLEKLVTFKGSRTLEELKEAYQNAHFVILVSQSEGWPKALAEGMFYGCIPIATPVSCIPWMLDFGERGVLAPPAPQRGAKYKEWIAEIAKRVARLTKNPEEMKRMSLAAQAWSQQYTVEKFEKAIKEILKPKKVIYKKSSSPLEERLGEG